MSTPAESAPVLGAPAPHEPPAATVLRVEGLTVRFPEGRGRWLTILDDVSFTLRQGEVLGLVGESGSGKTMTARSLLGLVPRPGRMTGSVQLGGREIAGSGEAAWNRIRGKQIGMVFQDAMSGLNPVRSIGSVLVEAVRRHSRVSRATARQRALDVLGAVGVPAPAERFGAYPHELSGGLRQRVMIALAIVNEPDVIVADEPTTALDATIQAQILERLRDLSAGSAILLITHDLGVAAALCDRVAVLYAGRLAEVGTARQVLRSPRHPYSAGLLRAVPRFDRERRALVPIPGAPPAAGEIPPSCAFAPRCPNAAEDCRERQPPLAPVDGRLAACFHPWDGPT